MTESPPMIRPRLCATCLQPLRPRAGPGRPALFCSPRCRQAAYLARRGRLVLRGMLAELEEEKV
jgi:hypothetical protein